MISQKKFDKIKKNYEDKMTEAFFKDDEKKLNALRLKFDDIFMDSELFLMSPEGQAFNLYYSYPYENEEHRCIILIESGQKYTTEQVEDMLNTETSDWQEIFDL